MENKAGRPIYKWATYIKEVEFFPRQIETYITKINTESTTFLNLDFNQFSL